MFEINEKIGGVVINSEDNFPQLKEVTRRVPRIQIVEGATILIERWDKNGIHEEVKVESIKKNKNRGIVKTNRGYFVFSIWNSKRDNIDSTWYNAEKGGIKEINRWVDGDKYYMNIL